MARLWSTRAYKEGDEHAIFELRKAAYPSVEVDQQTWLERWHWMYRENPAGNAKVWLAEVGDRIVGQSAVIPVRMKCGREVVTGFQSIDTLTHPDYRGQGIYTTLAQQAYAEAASEGMHVGYRFPNRNSHPIAVKKLDWFDVAQRRIMFKPCNWRNIVALKIRNRPLSWVTAIGAGLAFSLATLTRSRRPPVGAGVTVGEVDSFDDRINTFWDRVCKCHQVMVVRDKSYLNWRYADAPGVKYTILLAEGGAEIEGYLVMRCRQWSNLKVGAIYDVLALKQEVADCLIYEALLRFDCEKPDFVFGSIVAEAPVVSTFRKRGFADVSLLRKAPFCAYTYNERVPREFLADRRNWYSQLGDSDSI